MGSTSPGERPLPPLGVLLRPRCWGISCLYLHDFPFVAGAIPHESNAETFGNALRGRSCRQPLLFALRSFPGFFQVVCG